MGEIGFERYVLPALLAVLVFGVVIILVTSGDDGPAMPASSPADESRPTATARRGAARTMTVRAGDTPTSIAGRARIGLDDLLELNPELEPRTLRPGQRLKIRR
jgi:hypothetical protein